MSRSREDVLKKRSDTLSRRPAGETPNDRTYKAERARQLLDDEILVNAFDRVEVDALNAAVMAKDDDTRRERLQEVQALRRVRELIHAHVDAANAEARPAVTAP